MRISDWRSDVCSSDLTVNQAASAAGASKAARSRSESHATAAETYPPAESATVDPDPVVAEAVDGADGDSVAAGMAVPPRSPAPVDAALSSMAFSKRLCISPLWTPVTLTHAFRNQKNGTGPGEGR